ncbi:multidrug effflux MFS transporter [Pedobacter caeni]|uniref:MFS transporter, DHA1 family, bicyclomycin/chloramphenicol resistance protein n=1 Tax=Pedobacter caeni TaxID=288992 RepID=A0A1M5G5Z2_9SPHI|nr:multidrug effflux MFS transporter [Pedobacter caeni]SHF99129.1 MFS transporter, DHA1 family, bicyclomycin/chloramphenicol resistance protein [Pedobacter caeni]
MKENRKTLLITLTLGILTAIGSISIDIYLPAFEVMSLYFKVPLVRIETTVTFFLFGMAFGQLFIGPLSDIWGRKLPLRIGLIIYILCSICCVLTNSFTLFLILRFVQGLAGSACQVISRALVNDLYGDRKAAHVFTLLQILMGISPILAPMVGGMLAEPATWKFLFLIMALISALGLLGCLTILPAGRLALESKKLNLSGIRNAYIHCLKSPAFINYALLRAISNSAAFAFVTGSPFVLIQIYGLSKKEFGFVFSFLAIGIICTGLLNARLLSYYGAARLTKLAILIQVLSGLIIILFLYLNGSFIVLLLLTFVFMSMLGFILPNATALYLVAVSTYSGAGSALIGSMSYLSAFLITSLLSLLHNHTAYPMFIMMWACVVLAFLCLRYKKSG